MSISTSNLMTALPVKDTHPKAHAPKGPAPEVREKVAEKIEHRQAKVEKQQAHIDVKQAMADKVETKQARMERHLEMRESRQNDYSHLVSQQQKKMQHQMHSEMREQSHLKASLTKHQMQSDKLTEISEKVAGRFEVMQERAVANGKSVENLEAMSEKVSARLDAAINRVDHAAMKTMDLLKNRLDHNYAPDTTALLDSEPVDIEA